MIDWLSLLQRISTNDKRVVRLLLIVNLDGVPALIHVIFWDAWLNQQASSLQRWWCARRVKNDGVHAFSRCIKSTNNTEISWLSATVNGVCVVRLFVYCLKRVLSDCFESGEKRVTRRALKLSRHIKNQTIGRLLHIEINSWVPFWFILRVFFSLSFSLSLFFFQRITNLSTKTRYTHKECSIDI